MRKIGAEMPAGDLQGLHIDLSRSHLDGEHVLQLHNGKVSDQGPGTRLVKDAVHIFGSVLLVAALGECALAGGRSRHRKGSRIS